MMTYTFTIKKKDNQRGFNFRLAHPEFFLFVSKVCHSKLKALMTPPVMTFSRKYGSSQTECLSVNTFGINLRPER